MRRFGVLGVVVSGIFSARLSIGMFSVSGGDLIFIAIALAAAIGTGLVFLAALVALRFREATGRELMIVSAALTFALTVSYSIFNFFHGPEQFGSGNVPLLVVQVVVGSVLGCGALLSTLAAFSTPSPAERMNMLDQARDPRRTGTG